MQARASAQRSKDFSGAHSLRRACEEIVFAHAYPRLDMEVSKKMNHLLKAPFCIHPKTGKVHLVPSRHFTLLDCQETAVRTTTHHDLLCQIFSIDVSHPPLKDACQSSFNAALVQQDQHLYIEYRYSELEPLVEGCAVVPAIAVGQNHDIVSQHIRCRKNNKKTHACPSRYLWLQVCVPIDPAAANEFDVDAVPTTSQLVAELDAAPADRPAKVSLFRSISVDFSSRS